MKKWFFYGLAFVLAVFYLINLPSDVTDWLIEVLSITLVVPVSVFLASLTLICNFYFAKNYDNETRFAMSMALGSIGAVTIYFLLPIMISWSTMAYEKIVVAGELGLASILISVVVFFGNVVSSRLW